MNEAKQSAEATRCKNALVGLVTFLSYLSIQPLLDLRLCMIHLPTQLLVRSH